MSYDWRCFHRTVGQSAVALLGTDPAVCRIFIIEQTQSIESVQRLERNTVWTCISRTGDPKVQLDQNQSVHNQSPHIHKRHDIWSHKYDKGSALLAVILNIITVQQRRFRLLRWCPSFIHSFYGDSHHFSQRQILINWDLPLGRRCYVMTDNEAELSSCFWVVSSCFLVCSECSVLP